VPAGTAAAYPLPRQRRQDRYCLPLLRLPLPTLTNVSVAATAASLVVLLVLPPAFVVAAVVVAVIKALPFPVTPLGGREASTRSMQFLNATTSAWSRSSSILMTPSHTVCCAFCKHNTNCCHENSIVSAPERGWLHQPKHPPTKTPQRS
jgi:hypothetical protein